MHATSLVAVGLRFLLDIMNKKTWAGIHNLRTFFKNDRMVWERRDTECSCRKYGNMPFSNKFNLNTYGRDAANCILLLKTQSSIYLLVEMETFIFTF